MTVRAILFDLGDTLIGLGSQDIAALRRELARLLRDVGGAGPDVAAHLAGAMHAAIDAEIMQGFRDGLTDEHHLPEMLVRHAAVHGIRFGDDVAEAAGVLFGQADIGRFLLPDRAGDRLRAFRDAGYRVGLVSNTLTPPPMMEAFLTDAGMVDALEVRVYSCAEGLRKPHQAIYRAALQRLGVDAGETVFVGDRLREDVRGPQSVGMRAVLTHEFRAEEVTSATPKPDAVIRELPDLHDAIAGMNRVR